MPYKVLIVGAKGMLGQYLVEEFKTDCEVLAWDMAEIDITNREMVFEKIKQEDPDIVINSAAYNAVDKAESEEGYAMAYKVNALGPKYLAEVSKEVGAIFATYTSDYVFSGEKKEGYKEDDPTSPINKYGQSKTEGEKMVQAVGGDCYIIRTSKLFGKEGEGENVKKSFISLMQDLSLKLPELKVVDEEMSCFTYTKDLSQATKFLLLGNYPTGIYHLTNQDPCTWYGCAQTLFEILGKKMKLVPVSSSEFPRVAKRPKYSVLINTKLPQLRSYKEALEEFLLTK